MLKVAEHRTPKRLLNSARLSGGGAIRTFSSVWSASSGCSGSFAMKLAWRRSGRRRDAIGVDVAPELARARRPRRTTSSPPSSCGGADCELAAHVEQRERQVEDVVRVSAFERRAQARGPVDLLPGDENALRGAGGARRVENRRDSFAAGTCVAANGVGSSSSIETAAMCSNVTSASCADSDEAGQGRDFGLYLREAVRYA